MKRICTFNHGLRGDSGSELPEKSENDPLHQPTGRIDTEPDFLSPAVHNPKYFFAGVSILIGLKTVQVLLDDSSEPEYLAASSAVCATGFFLVCSYAILWRTGKITDSCLKRSIAVLLNLLVIYFAVAEPLFLGSWSNETDILIGSTLLLHHTTECSSSRALLFNSLFLSGLNLLLVLFVANANLGSVLSSKGAVFLIVLLIHTYKKPLMAPANSSRTSQVMAEIPELQPGRLEGTLKNCDFVLDALELFMSTSNGDLPQRKLKKSQNILRKLKKSLVDGGNMDYLPDESFHEDERMFYEENFTNRARNAHSMSSGSILGYHHPIEVPRSPEIKSILSGIGKFWNFDIWFVKRTANSTVTAIATYLFEQWGITKQLRQTPAVVKNYFSKLEAQYKENPYHNAGHAADVACSLLYFITHSELLHALSLDELLASFLACLGHDVAHPGVNNRFLVNTRSKLALKYNDISVLENMHSYTTFSLMSGDCNILSFLPREQYEPIRKQVIEMILATDMSKHFESYNRFKAKKFANSLDLWDLEDRSFVMSFALKCADVGHSAKRLEIHKEWTLLITQEFFAQGDLEKAHQLPVSMWFDRKHTNIPRSQIGFLRHICLPLFEEFIDYLSNSELTVACIHQLKENISYWESAAMQKKRSLNPARSTQNDS